LGGERQVLDSIDALIDTMRRNSAANDALISGDEDVEAG
jgi:hypothetical protein